MDWKIRASGKPLRGEVIVPPDKSVSHRAVMFGALCSGKVKIRNFLFAEDCMRTLNAFTEMGCRIERSGSDVMVWGKGLNALSSPGHDLYLGNSGTTMRIISGIIAGSGISAVLTGDESLSRRPMDRIISPLREMGAIISAVEGNFPPLSIHANSKRIAAINYKTPVASAQIKSSVLAAGLFADGVTSVTEPLRSRDHTERMLKHFSAQLEVSGLTTKITGGRELSAAEITVPGDISSAAFFIVGASLLEGSDIILKKTGLNPTRKGIIDVMLRMGANIEIIDKREGVEVEGDLRVKYSKLNGTVISAEEIPLLIDEVPILIVAALNASGETIFHGINELKVKESDRVKCMAENLKLMGHEIFEEENTLRIPGNSRKQKTAEFNSYGDHRIAMSMAIASLLAKGDSIIRNTSCVETSYPLFMRHFELLGAI